MTVQILVGDCREKLRGMPAGSVHCVVVSPPYYGLRDYGTGTWEGGAAGCDHVSHEIRTGAGMAVLGERYAGGGHKAAIVKPVQFRHECAKCGAVKTDSQIGLEQSPAQFVAALVEVFGEVWRVLRDDGTVWLNLGDSYANDQKWGGCTGGVAAKGNHGQTGIGRGRRYTGLKPKELIGIPWRVAFALQDAGWYLRQDIVWSKPNPMPESVRDRCTKAHEYIFMLTKRERYFYDATAIAETAIYSGLANQDASGFKSPASFNGKHREGYRSAGRRRGVPPRHAAQESSGRESLDDVSRGGVRNKRSVWTVATAPFAEAHFATFPPALIEPCILAGTSERGCCVHCGAGWSRVERRVLVPGTGAVKAGVVDERDVRADANDQGSNRQRDGRRNGMISEVSTLGWWPTCECEGLGDLPDYPKKPRFVVTAEDKAAVAAWEDECALVDIARGSLCHLHRGVPTGRAVVLDMFGGAGTTGLVADRLRRDAVLIELNPTYAEMARRRIFNDAPLFQEAAQ